MTFIYTCQFIYLLAVCLRYLTTALGASPGFYNDPFSQQPHTVFVQRTWPALLLWKDNTVVTWDKSLVDNQDRAMSLKKPVVDYQGYALTQGRPLDSHGHAKTREGPVVDNQGHAMSRNGPVVDSQDHVMTREKAIVGFQGQVTKRDKSVIDNQGQDLEDDSVKQTQQKYVLYPNRWTEELTLRGGDSITFVEDRKIQQSERDSKLISGRGNVCAGNRANEVPYDSTSSPPATVRDPSRCVWAIISCCSPTSNRVRYPCFELLGCSGPFWDTNPCSEGMTGAAIKVAGEFYSSGKYE